MKPTPQCPTCLEPLDDKGNCPYFHAQPSAPVPESGNYIIGIDLSSWPDKAVYFCKKCGASETPCKHYDTGAKVIPAQPVAPVTPRHSTGCEGCAVCKPTEICSVCGDYFADHPKYGSDTTCEHSAPVPSPEAAQEPREWLDYHIGRPFGKHEWRDHNGRYHDVAGLLTSYAASLRQEIERLTRERDEANGKLERLEEGYFRNTSDEEARLRLMEQGDPTWDLSFNDRCAIAWVLDALKFTRVKLEESNKAKETAERELAEARDKAIKECADVAVSQSWCGMISCQQDSAKRILDLRAQRDSQ